MAIRMNYKIIKKKNKNKNTFNLHKLLQPSGGLRNEIKRISLNIASGELESCGLFFFFWVSKLLESQGGSISSDTR